MPAATKPVKRSLSLAAVLAIAGGQRLSAQLSGPPAGVPVPPAPMASEQPKAEPEAAVSVGDLHFRVRMLDGRNGVPLRGERLRLWYDEMDGPGYLLTTDEHGEALMPAPPSAPVRVLLQPEALFDCRKPSPHEAAPGYNLQQTETKGLFAENRCETGVRATPHPGELTLFARPLRWYERVNQP